MSKIEGDLGAFEVGARLAYPSDFLPEGSKRGIRALIGDLVQGPMLILDDPFADAVANRIPNLTEGFDQLPGGLTGAIMRAVEEQRQGL